MYNNTADIAIGRSTAQHTSSCCEGGPWGTLCWCACVWQSPGHTPLSSGRGSRWTLLPSRPARVWPHYLWHLFLISNLPLSLSPIIIVLYMYMYSTVLHVYRTVHYMYMYIVVLIFHWASFCVDRLFRNNLLFVLRGLSRAIDSASLLDVVEFLFSRISPYQK